MSEFDSLKDRALIHIAAFPGRRMKIEPAVIVALIDCVAVAESQLQKIAKEHIERGPKIELDALPSRTNGGGIRCQ